MQANEFPTRRRRIAAALAEKNVDALIVSGAANLRYLTGFTGSNGVLLLSPGTALLVTDPRYQIQAAQETNCQVKVVRGSLYPALMKAAARRKFRRLGFEKDHLRYAVYDQLQAELALGASLEPVGGLVEAHRLVKSATEIELIRRSVETNSAAFAKVMRRAGEGARDWAPLRAGTSHFFMMSNGEKQSVALDLTSSRRARRRIRPQAHPAHSFSRTPVRHWSP